MVALTLGPLGFLPTLRLKRPRRHRTVGRVHVLAVLLGGVAGLHMAMFAYMGGMTGLGFALLACLWLYRGARAFLSIRRGHVQAHRRWMIRNHALTLRAVRLRVQLLALRPGLDFESSYVVVAWSSWLVRDRFYTDPSEARRGHDPLPSSFSIRSLMSPLLGDGSSPL
ncbi:Predicted membrane protein [Deinococcus reticulitermitis]|uniref:Predicted membrane protein n=2 Tax=Deinococcus reticulitermitis TaxID=856736 RepID=A0A1H6RTY2_9DEIO|nr:Predicted membrane protein [Deinococcus reticulitermitis]